MCIFIAIIRETIVLSFNSYGETVYNRHSRLLSNLKELPITLYCHKSTFEQRLHWSEPQQTHQVWKTGREREKGVWWAERERERGSSSLAYFSFKAIINSVLGVKCRVLFGLTKAMDSTRLFICAYIKFAFLLQKYSFSKSNSNVFIAFMLVLGFFLQFHD